MTVALVVLVIALAVLALAWTARTFHKMRGTRLVTCPDNHLPAAVEVGAARATFGRLVGLDDLRLRNCSRWPEEAGCGEECLAQIEAAPEDCLVRTILAHWYVKKSCAICGRELGPIDWAERKPALLAPDGKTLDWRQLVPEEIPEVLRTHAPVCFDCHVAETFRRLYPGLVVDR